jgi:hypothetical protein
MAATLYFLGNGSIIQVSLYVTRNWLTELHIHDLATPIVLFDLEIAFEILGKTRAICIRLELGNSICY